MPSLLAMATISCLMLFPLAPISKDMKIVTRQSLGNRNILRTEYLSGADLREQSDGGSDNAASHHLATIIHHGDIANQNFILDLDTHEFVSFQTDKNGMVIGARRPAINYGDGALDVFIQSTDTGERKQMFGQTARHIIIKEARVPGPGSSCEASESETDGWYIDPSALPDWRWPRSRAYVAIGGCRDKIQVHRSGVEPGFPMKLTTTFHQQMRGADAKVMSSTNTMEVVEFSSATLDPALFIVPPDFHQVSQLSYMTRPNPQPPTAWERFRNWVSEIFR